MNGEREFIDDKTDLSVRVASNLSLDFQDLGVVIVVGGVCVFASKTLDLGF
jgi:hypothetical protein